MGREAEAEVAVEVEAVGVVVVAVEVGPVVPPVVTMHCRNGNGLSLTTVDLLDFFNWLTITRLSR